MPMPAMRFSPAPYRGSALIFAIGVLMLLAIVATSFLASSRQERASAQFNGFNTQADLLMDGLMNAASAEIAGDASDATGHKPWLASRVPVTTDPNSAYNGNRTNDAGSNLACWPAIGMPVLGEDSFESPICPAAASAAFYTDRNRAFPTRITIAGSTWPALAVNVAKAGAAAQYQTFLAADADGDGVADAGLFKLPIGQLAGITYYGAVRIIDNNAAINLNTAFSRDVDFLGDGSVLRATSNLLAGAFTSAVGLAELLRSTAAATDTDSLPPELTASAFTSSGTAIANEFAAITRYRMNLSDTVTFPTGITGAAAGHDLVYDDSTSPAGPRADATGRVPEFQFATLGDCLQSQLSSRLTAPGLTDATGSLTRGRSSFPATLTLATRFCLSNHDDASQNHVANALSLSLEYGGSLAAFPGSSVGLPGTPVAEQPYDGRTAASGINTWFATHFNYLNESPANPATLMSRRTILTGTNGVGNQSNAPAMPPGYLFCADDPQWDWRNPVVYPPFFTPVGQRDPIPTLPMAVASSTSAASASRPGIDLKVSINTGRFEELFYAYFKVMAQPGFDGLANDKGTPFSRLYSGDRNPRSEAAPVYSAIAMRNLAAIDIANGIYAASDGTPGNHYYNDPYIGTRFIPPTPAAPLLAVDRPEPTGLASVISGQSSSTSQLVIEQHPLRMFRSPLRPPPVRTAANAPPTAAVWDRTTPYLPADQVLILRAGIAAANLEAIRDSSHDPLDSDASYSGNARTAVHRIPLTAYIYNTATPVVAKVYGLRVQPYITEIYANTSARVNGAAPPAPPAFGVPNPKGYIAIKIFNPTAVPISLQHCRLVGLRRTSEVPYSAAAADQYPDITVRPLAALQAGYSNDTDQIDLGAPAIVSNVLGPLYPPYVVPAHGTLVLENLPGAGPPFAGTAAEDATYRPTSSGLLSTTNDNTGLITPVDFTTQNFAYVPGLSRVVWDRDVVLMRPANCQPPSPSSDVANTLIYIHANPDVAAASDIGDMLPLDSYDFTGLAPLNDAAYTPARPRAEMWHYVRTVAPTSAATGGWRWVYPGRYDADQSIPTTAGQLPAPRQQGTYRATGADGQFGWDPAHSPDKDPLAERPTPGVTVSLGVPISTGTTATYPDQFTICLDPSSTARGNRLHDFTVPDATGHPRPNLFPFGGFSRLGGLLQVPFIGAYTLQTEANAAAGNDRYLEITPVTMDAVFAEDTDPADNENPASDDGSLSREQVGRFVPLRPTTGGRPAIDAFQTNPPAGQPPTVGPANDPAFDTATPATMDPFRYSDDKPDDDSRPLPAGTDPAIDNPRCRTNRYAFAKTLFDHFAVFAPHDDYVPNYPTQPRWRPGTAYSVGDTIQYGQHIFVCRTAHTSGDAEAATLGAPDFLDAGTAARPPTASWPSPPRATINWQPLPRYALANGHAPAGCRSDIWTDAPGNPRPYDFWTGNDQNELQQTVPGLINMNTAPEKVLAMLPWCVRQSSIARGDRLTFSFDAYPPTVTAGGDGIDDNAQIAHAIILYRDGRYASAPSGNANALNIGHSTQTWAAAAEPFHSLFDLYRVPGIKAAQNTLLAMQQQSTAGTDAGSQTLLLNRVSSLITTRSDSFTLYAVIQGWRDVGTDHPSLVVRRSAAAIIDRSINAAAEQRAKLVYRVPTH